MSKLKKLIERKINLNEQLEAIKSLIELNMEDIQAEVAAQLATVRAAQAKEFGAVNVTVDGFKITETVPKKVKWDQPVLASLFTKIMAAGDDPNAYMKVELSVPEKLYDGFDPQVRVLFEAARVVEKGKPTLKIEGVES